MSSSYCNVKDFEFKYYKKVSWERNEDCLHFGIFFPIFNNKYDFNKTLCDRYMLENDGAKTLNRSYIDVLKEKTLSTSICVECLNNIYKTLIYFKRLSSFYDYNFEISEEKLDNILKYVLFRCKDKWHNNYLDLANSFLLNKTSRTIDVWNFEESLTYKPKKTSSILFFNWDDAYNYNRDEKVKRHVKIAIGNDMHYSCEDEYLKKNSKYDVDGKCIKCIDNILYFYSEYIKFLNPLFVCIDNCLKYKEDICYVPKISIL